MCGPLRGRNSGPLARIINAILLALHDRPRPRLRLITSTSSLCRFDICSGCTQSDGPRQPYKSGSIRTTKDQPTTRHLGPAALLTAYGNAVVSEPSNGAGGPCARPHTLELEGFKALTSIIPEWL